MNGGNMNDSYLAVDIGASSGRLILGSLNPDGKLVAEEIHRFQNVANKRNGFLCWDYEYIFREIMTGMRKCRELGKPPVSVGVDTWGVDFVLLDPEGRIIGDTVSYRDQRTTGADRAVGEIIGDAEHYAKCGIQKMPINTIYQLWTVRDILGDADRFLMVPDYFHYLLTGKASNEYTIATTTALVNAAVRDWDRGLIAKLSYPEKLFGKLSFPGDALGNLKPGVARLTGFDCRVTLPASHDTGSAVAAAPLAAGTAYISSGTWSLIGVETEEPLTGENSRLSRLTNEGGAFGTYRYLKNVMGLWMIQEIQRELGIRSHDRLNAMAGAERGFKSVVDVTNARYLSPGSMLEEVRAECAETGQQVPGTPGEVARCIYLSLAQAYAKTIRELSGLTGSGINRICIVGGGCKNTYLNRLTAEETGLEVSAGPVEATALGNIAVQMIADGVVAGISGARQLIKDSFPPTSAILE